MTGVRAAAPTDVPGPNAVAAVAAVASAASVAQLAPGRPLMPTASLAAAGPGPSLGHVARDAQTVAAPGPQLHLLGGFGLQVGESAVPLTPGQQRLVALLGLRGRALHRGYVAGLLWGDSSEARALGSLRSTLWKLHALSPGVVLISGDSLTLAPDVPVDIRHATELARALITDRFDDNTTSALLEPRFCYELLPGWYEDWVIVERERHRQLSLHALELACEHLTAQHRYGAAMLAGLAAVDRDPLRESAHRAVMKIHIAEGNGAEAIRRYRQYEKIAAKELGVPPSPMMRALLNEVTAL
jgi:DNA-binding SARP family transcriptional activator